MREVEEKETEETRQVPIINPFTLFNLDQIEGIKLERDILQLEFNPVEKWEAVIGVLL